MKIEFTGTEKENNAFNEHMHYAFIDRKINKKRVVSVNIHPDYSVVKQSSTWEIPEEQECARLNAPPVAPQFGKLAQNDQDYNNAIRRCQVWLEQGGIVYDCETSDFRSNGGEIIQLTIADLNTAEILFSSHFKPQESKISSGAFDAHGISMDMLKDAPLFADHAQEIFEIIYLAQNRICYNVTFDPEMINFELRRAKVSIIPGLDHTKNCAMHRAAEIVNKIGWRGTYEWQKLENMMKKFNIEWQGQAHDASADVLATIGVINAIAALPLRFPKVK